MVALHHAYTAPINPPSASPTLTTAQVWAGLQRKIRHAQEFVPLITECHVLTDKSSPNGTVVREVIFKTDPSDRVREEVKSYAPMKVDFHQSDGSLVSNIVSEGADGELFMTYAFVWLGKPGEEGSEEAKKALEESRRTARMAVEGSIETIRRLVREGKV